MERSYHEECKCKIWRPYLIMVQKLWSRFKYLWQMDWLTDKWDLMSPCFRKSGGQKDCLYMYLDSNKLCLKKVFHKCQSLLSSEIIFSVWIWPCQSQSRVEREDYLFCLNLTLARARAEYGVSSAGLSTTVHPAAIAAPAFLVNMALGKFHCKTRWRCYYDWLGKLSISSHK